MGCRVNLTWCVARICSGTPFSSNCFLPLLHCFATQSSVQGHGADNTQKTTVQTVRWSCSLIVSSQRQCAPLSSAAHFPSAATALHAAARKTEDESGSGSISCCNLPADCHGGSVTSLEQMVMWLEAASGQPANPDPVAHEAETKRGHSSPLFVAKAKEGKCKSQRHLEK